MYVPRRLTMKQLLITAVTLAAIFPLLSLAANSDLKTKEEYVEKLTPKLEVKTRAIRLNGEQAAVEEPTPAPTVSMQINFEYDSYQLTKESKTKLQPLGEALVSEQLLAYSFNLAGHTDATGSNVYNQSLSGKRALAVGQYLYDTFGVDPARLKLAGHGEEQLLDAANPTSAANRRVEITTIVN